MVWLRDLMSSAMTFLLCVTGLAVLLDPDQALIRLQELGDNLVQYLLYQLNDLPSMIESLLRGLKR